MSDLPVCAGFGVRTAKDVSLISKHADGAIVGSALVETMEKTRYHSIFRGLRKF